jgi:hypothetical protein
MLGGHSSVGGADYTLSKRTEWTAEHTKEEHVNENSGQTNAAEVPGLQTRVRWGGDPQRALRRERIGAGDDRLRPRPGRLPQLRITQCCSADRLAAAQQPHPAILCLAPRL